jgi:signal transduction histidine kinase
LNAFDASIISFVNNFVHRWFALDATVALIATNTLFSGGAIAAMIWWAWFRPNTNQNAAREFLTCGIFSAFLSVLVARTLAGLLPYRERPIHRPELHLRTLTCLMKAPSFIGVRFPAITRPCFVPSRCQSTLFRVARVSARFATYSCSY